MSTDSGMDHRGPLADSYPAAALLVVCALVPYLALAAAVEPLRELIAKGVGLSPQGFQTTTSMADAGYALGTVLAVQLGTKLHPRRMLLIYAAGLLAASVDVALATSPAAFIAGHIVQGLCTSLMLIGAVPPLVTGWPAKKMPITVGIMNLCIFGAVAIGPVVGGVQAAAAQWRPLFWIAAGVAAAALALVLATWEDDPPSDPEGPWDFITLVLAGGGCGAAFFGASELTTHAFLSSVVLAPLLGGVAIVIALIVYQGYIPRPLAPMRELASSVPVAGIIAALSAGAASLPAIDLVQLAIKPTGTPAHLAMLFWPFFGSAVAMAAAFGALLLTRWLSALVLVGLVALAAGIAVMSGVVGGPHTLVVVGSGLVGIGVGAAVAPAMFMVGYSLRAIYLQRVLAMVELLRAVAAFLTVPLVVHLAQTTDGGVKGTGIEAGLWTCFAIACVGGVLFLAVLTLGGVRPQRPDIEHWQGAGEAAWDTPELMAGLH